jgi:hypothetical protein
MGSYFRYYRLTILHDDDEGAIVIYGPPGSCAGCDFPSFCIWMVPGTAREVVED